MSVEEIRSTFEPIVATLDRARELDIVHRDIKPENIFMVHPAWGGGVRLLDFGFARLSRAPSVTAAGMVTGSPSYIAPEAWMGTGELDHRADVYSLGVVLFRVVGGRLPFSGPTIEVMKQVTQGRRPSLRSLRPDLPPALDTWAAQALSIDRETRFQRVSALYNALLACVGHTS